MKFCPTLNKFISLIDISLHGEILFMFWMISPKLLQTIFWIAGERDWQIYAHLQKVYYDHYARIDPINAVVGSFNEQESYPYEKYLLQPLLKPCSKFIVLDFGCGPGRMIKRLARIFKRVDGVDITPNNIIWAKKYVQKLHSQPNFYINNGYDLASIPANTYDFLYTTIALHHIPIYKTRINLLTEFHRVLKSKSWMSLQMVYKKSATRLPILHRAARWRENIYFANGTNGFYDVVITQPDLPIIREDLEKIGFKKVSFRFAPPIPRKTSPYDNWIFIYAYKP